VENVLRRSLVGSGRVGQGGVGIRGGSGFLTNWASCLFSSCPRPVGKKSGGGKVVGIGL
jgi:hypothetical protein